MMKEYTTDSVKDIQQLEAENQWMKKMLSVKRKQLGAVLELTKAVNSNFSADGLLRLLQYIVKGHLNIEHASLRLRDNHWQEAFQTDCSSHLDRDTILNLSQFQFVQRVANWPHADLSPFQLLIPVMHKSVCLGFLLVSELPSDIYDSEEEKIKFIRTITNIILVALENKRLLSNQIEQERLKKEMEWAGQLQQTLIPSDLPNNKKLQIAATYQPHGKIGGDYYDYIPLQNNKAALCMCDVSGKGLTAGMIMVNFQGLLHQVLMKDAPLTDILKELNERLYEVTKGNKFVTMFIALLDHANNTLEYVNAGHEVALLKHQNEVKRLTKGCMLLGAMPSLLSLESEMLTIEPDSLLLMYTDGLSDQTNPQGETFGTKRVEEQFKDYQEKDPSSLINQYSLSLKNFRGNASFCDDISLMAVRFPG